MSRRKAGASRRCLSRAIGFVAGSWLTFLLSGCHPVMSTPPMNDQPPGQLEGNEDAAPADWPLRFKAHYFGAHCFDTLRCTVLYESFPHGHKDESAPSIASYGRPLEKLLTAGRGPIRNFPPSAKVAWVSKDGVSHDVEVDIGEIFKDELIRHNLSKDEMPDATLASDHAPEIILEVNDRTISVYTRTHLSTKVLQEPGNRHSGFRNDLIKVYSRTY